MNNISTYIIEKFRINKDTKLADNIDIKDALYSFIKDALENDLGFSPYQYVVSHDTVDDKGKERYFIIRKCPGVKRNLTYQMREELYDIVARKAKETGIKQYLVGKDNQFEKLHIYYRP